jgi:hypothetical protein
MRSAQCAVLVQSSTLLCTENPTGYLSYIIPTSWPPTNHPLTINHHLHLERFETWLSIVDSRLSSLLAPSHRCRLSTSVQFLLTYPIDCPFSSILPYLCIRRRGRWDTLHTKITTLLHHRIVCLPTSTFTLAYHE